MQTTDKKVNEVTPALFEMAPDADVMATLEVSTQGRCLGMCTIFASLASASSQFASWRTDEDLGANSVVAAFKHVLPCLLPSVGHEGTNNKDVPCLLSLLLPSLLHDMTKRSSDRGNGCTGC